MANVALQKMEMPHNFAHAGSSNLHKTPLAEDMASLKRITLLYMWNTPKEHNNYMAQNLQHNTR